MRTHVPLLLLVAACSTAAADPSPRPRTDPATRIWIGKTEQLAGHHVLPSLHERDRGAELIVSVAIPVARTDELAATEIGAELLVSGGGLACKADKELGFTETGGMNAQATIICANRGRAMPTHLVVRLRRQTRVYPLRLRSLTAPI
jgi:hypothetical protein